ncbi:MAG TPA: ComEC/Rec2 family competence protein [Ktedonobacteraceae bacterium]|nr:ComEC/Rec2 family competence protein [Ktedonobacteraceae bacterium]
MESSKKEATDLHGLILVVVTVAWLAGILLGRREQIPALVSLIGAAIALISVIVFWRSDRGILLALIVLWFMLGAWRYAIVNPNGDPQAISTFIGSTKLEVRGMVADEPKLDARSRLLIVAANDVSTDNGSSWRDAHGRIEVIIPGSFIDNPYGPNYGDDVELRGKLEDPLPHSTPDIFASMTFPALTVNASGGIPVIAALFQLRTRLAIIIEQSLPPSPAAILIAILLSLHTPALIPLIPYFNETGTAHLIAPSGFKVTILASLVLASTRWLYERHDKQVKLLPAQKRRDWRHWLATTLAILSIIIYTFLSGAGPAAIRAGIMGILLVIAPCIGRIYNIYTALALAAFLMSIVDPFVLWDVGFQLSFVGTLGIVMLTPFFRHLFRFLEHFPFGHVIADINAVSLAAQIATWPIIAITFSQVSFIAPLANVSSVPLLGVLIVLGMLICTGGSSFIPVGILFGWIARPGLWYMQTIIPFLAGLPGAYRTVTNFNILFVWGYYGLLGLVVIMLFCRWPQMMQEDMDRKATPVFSRLTRSILQGCAALVIVLATVVSIRAAPQHADLTITFLNVVPTGQRFQQGESILIQTPDGKTVLIDGGPDADSLSQQLHANNLPPLQRSFDAVILTTPRQDHLVGLQDVVTRYQIGEVIDAGMLHPTAGYALWRRTISDRGFTYVQARQHSTIPIGSQLLLQVLWPPSPLHKSSDEELDNTLVMRLVAPGFRMLLLGAAALSKYALNEIVSTVDPSYLQANVVQIMGEAGKAFPAPLGSVLSLAHPSRLVITPAMLSATLRKAGQSTIITPTPFAGASWQVVQTAQVGTVVISSSGSGWTLNPTGILI